MMSSDQSKHSEGTYQYRPLSPELEEIRLISIEDHGSQRPGSDDRNTIRCSLQHAYLEDTPRYTALSYTWGDPSIKAAITLDGRRIQVTRSLELALRHLLMEQRSTGDEKLFWVDAVCIDQHNEGERSHQVSQMGKIFNTALETIIWLGASSRDSDLAFQSLSELSVSSMAVQLRGSINSWSLFPFDEAISSPTGRAVLEELENVLVDLKCNGSAKLAAIISLYERPWFRRVWVIQERVLSRNCVIYCGSSGRMYWRDFIRAFWLLCGVRDYLNIASTAHQDSSKLATSITAALDRVVPVVFTCYGLSLLQLLSMLSRSAPRGGLEASDRRDYIYSLLGLINTRSSPTIKVDYSQEWTTVRTELGRAALLHYGLCMLSFAATSRPGPETSSEVQHAQAPSWAPDWSSSHLPQPLYVPSIFFVRGGNVGCPYQAARNSTQDLSSRSFAISGQLSLSAFYVDHVACLGQPLMGDDYPTDDLDRVASLSAWLHEMDALLPSSVNEVYSTTEQVQDALWKTPVVDRAYVYAWETARASEKTYSSYQAVRAGNVAKGVKYTNIAYNKLFQRRPFRSAKGYIGLGPFGTCEDDTIWILPGTDVPFIFRSAGVGKFTVIGEAYVHGIMDGELLDHGLDEHKITLE